MTEQWKAIKGYEGLYEVSSSGRVRSIQFRNNQTCFDRTLIMNPFDNGNGYMTISLSKNGIRKNHYVHRLVAQAFLENPRALKFVNHKNFDRGDNRLENLEYCSQSYNIRYSKHRMSKSKNTTRTTSTGYKYIYKRKGKYRVCFVKFRIEKGFCDLKEAISYRNMFMENHSDYYKGVVNR